MSKELVPAALVYDFDGTLARGNIQEHTFFGELGMSPDDFWPPMKEEARAQDADEILVYMRHMLLHCRRLGIPLTRELLERHGRETPLFAGVGEWFGRINAQAQEIGLDLRHYVISSGIREMIQGCPIASYFQQIFASSFLYDQGGEAVWPAVAINYTVKTQFLFRINKGIDNSWDNEAVNRWVPMSERPMPFENMIFVGDGETDIPAMKMVRHQGGFSVGVFDPEKWESKQSVIHRLIAADRVNHVAPADFRAGSQLDVTLRGLLGRVAERARPR